MTSRLRPRTRRVGRSLFEAEDRRDLLVNLGFVALIVLLAIGLLAAFALAYYDQNLRPLARVGSTEISPAQVRERTALDATRLARDEGRLRLLHQTQEIDTTTLNSELQEINSREQQLTDAFVAEELIDVIFQSQLAVQENVAPAASDIDAAVEEEFKTPERRHILLISVKPEVSSGATVSTVSQRAAAISRAEEALTALNGGSDWATVARQYSSDPSAANGGDGGVISENNPSDAFWVESLFDLPQGGTTGVVAALGCARGDAGECVYRIGRVVEVIPGTTDDAYRDRLLGRVSMERLREILGWEVAARRLREAIVERATSGAVDQVHLAEIIIRNTASEEEDGEAAPSPEPEADLSEIHYSQILYAPNDNPEAAADLPADDPAWASAKGEADAALAELSALTDAQARSDRFAEIARAQSDDAETKEDGGERDFTTRDLLPEEVAKALFDAEHQNGALVGPVKDEFGYYVLLFHERRGSPTERLEELKKELAAGADWNTLVDKYSDAEESDKADGGDIGWYTREMLSAVEAETVDKIFGLKSGEVSEPIEFGTDTFIFKALEHTSRELDPNQIVRMNDPDFGAFSEWYTEKKAQAEEDGVIVRAGEETEPGVEDGEPTSPA